MSLFRFFSSREWLPAGTPHIPYLAPFWGAPTEDPRDPQRGAFDRWLALGKTLAEQSALNVAEAAVLPFDWTAALTSTQHQRTAAQALAECRGAGKPLLVFFWNDSSKDLDLPGAIILRTSVDRGPRYGVQEFACPSWQEDPRRWASEVQLTEGRPRRLPGISFCGYVGQSSGWRSTVKELLRTGLGRFHSLLPRLCRTPLELRRAALSVLSGDRRIQSRFIARTAFYGGALADERNWDYEHKARVKQEYVENMCASDYVLCIRGAGNYSMRYFDSLALGRVPVVIDTGGGFPYDFEVPWPTRGPWISVEDLSSLPERLLEFHAHHTPQTLDILQRENRKLWEQWLSPEGFFRELPRHIARARNQSR
jgi:hypothetical protein